MYWIYTPIISFKKNETGFRLENEWFLEIKKNITDIYSKNRIGLHVENSPPTSSIRMKHSNVLLTECNKQWIACKKKGSCVVFLTSW